MYFGAHMSTAGGLHKAPERVSNIGGNCLQIFSTSPRGWKPAEISKEQVEKFQQAKREYGVDPVYFHAAYLINLAGSPATQEKSVRSLTAELQAAERLGVKGTIVHLGSFLKDAQGREADRHKTEFGSEYDELLGNIRTVLQATPPETLFIIENMGMRKIGLALEEIAFLIKELKDERVRVCLDTCHLHAAGYDLSGPDKLQEFLDRFDKLIGLDRLEVWHINDSRDEFGSLRDRHENLKEGQIPAEVFTSLLNSDRIKDRPFILETPGFDDNGPDKDNMDILKSLIQ